MARKRTAAELREEVRRMLAAARNRKSAEEIKVTLPGSGTEHTGIGD